MSYVLFPSTIKPTGLFPSHEDTFGKGGFVALTGDESTLVDYTAISNFLNEQIPTLRRKVGMLAYVSSINQYYTCSSVTGDDGISGDWSRQYFSGRYFHGPSAPELNDLQVGERWFDTVAGTEYTYIPIEEGSTYNAWVDIDHIGSGGLGTMTYFYGDEIPSGATVGSKWFNTVLGAELTYLPNPPDSSGETGNIWVMVNSLAQGVSSGIYVLKTGDTMSGTLTGTNASFTGLTASNGFIGTLTADRAFRQNTSPNFEENEFITKSYGDEQYSGGDLSVYVKKSGDTMSGSLTGTDASFDTVEGSTGVFSFLGIGSDTFSAQDIIDPDAEPIIFGVTGGRNSYFDTNVTIGASGSTSKGWLWVRGGLDESVNSFQVEGNSVFRDDVEIGKDSLYALNFGSTAYQGTQNPNVPVIKSAGGVLIGGNTYAKQNWLGNNVYLAPEGYVFAGFPNNIPTNWFSADGGTYPFNLYSLNITGGIHTDRAYRWGHKKGQNTFLDDEFVTRKSVMMRRAVQSGSNPIQFSQTWSQSSGSSNFLFASLTTKKMGFDFPVDLTFRVAGGAGGGGQYSTRWFVKTITNVKPTGNTVEIYVDRDKQITWNNGNNECASISGNDVNTYNIGGYIQGNNNNGEAWCFLEIAPSPTGPISYGQ